MAAATNLIILPPVKESLNYKIWSRGPNPVNRTNRMRPRFRSNDEVRNRVKVYGLDSFSFGQGSNLALLNVIINLRFQKWHKFSS
jgi:hypothetical protein